MEAQTPFVRPDRIVELNAIAAVGPNVARVVRPTHSKNDSAVRFGKSLEDLRISILCMLVRVRNQIFGGFTHSLMKLRLARIAANKSLHELVDFSVMFGRKIQRHVSDDLCDLAYRSRSRPAPDLFEIYRRFPTAAVIRPTLKLAHLLQVPVVVATRLSQRIAAELL